MAKAPRHAHVLVVADDLEAAAGFFEGRGRAREGASPPVGGDWVGTTVGLDGVRSEIGMLALPGPETKLEISKFHAPVHPDGPQAPPANRFGLNNVAFEVDDLDAVLERLRGEGYEP